MRYLYMIWFAVIICIVSLRAETTPSWYLKRSTSLLYIDLDSAEYFVGRALALCDSGTSDSLLARIYVSQANVARLKGDYEIQWKAIRKAESLNDIPDTATLIDVANLYGLYYWKQVQYDSAVYYYGVASEIGYAANDSFVIARSCNNAGNIYLQSARYDKAIETYEEGIRYTPHNQSNSVLIGWLHSNISIALRHNGDYEKSLEHTNIALVMSEQAGAIVIAQYATTNRGATLYKLGRYEEAEKALLRSTASARENKLFPSLVKSLYHLAEVYIAQGKFIMAEDLGLEILLLARKYDLPDDIKYGYEMQYLAFKAAGKTEKALMAHERFKEVEDSLFTLESDQSMARIDAKYKSAIKDLELKNSMITIQRLTNNNRLILMRLWFALSAALLVVILIWLYLSRRSLKRQREMQESFTQNLLIATENERKNIASELHDQVGQKLSMLKYAIDGNDKNMSGQLVTESLSDIRKVSRELYPWQIEKLGIKSALEDLVQRSEKASNILLTYEIDDVDDILDKVTAIQVYRIIQECLTNVMRHSEARSGRIILVRSAERVELTIQDNGKGFDFREAFKNSKSLGLQTLIGRVKQLSGTFNIDSMSGRGSKWFFSIPV